MRTMRSSGHNSNSVSGGRARGCSTHGADEGLLSRFTLLEEAEGRLDDGTATSEGLGDDECGSICVCV